MSQYTVPDVEIAVEVQEDDSIMGAVKRAHRGAEGR